MLQSVDLPPGWQAIGDEVALILKDVIALMHEVPVFSGMDAGQLKLIAYVAASVEFRAGDTVIAAGAPANAVLVVASGTLATSDGAEERRFERGDMLGEISALSGVDEPMAIVAATDAKAIRIERTKFEALLQKYPGFQRALLKHLALRLARQDSASP